MKNYRRDIKIRRKSMLAARLDGRSLKSEKNLLAGYLRIGLFVLLLMAALGIIADDITATLDSDNGSSSFSFRDSGSALVASIDSDGNIMCEGTLEVKGAGDSVISGNLGAGGVSDGARLDINGNTETWTSNGWKKALELDNIGSIKWENNPGQGKMFGLGQSGAGLYFMNSTADDASAPADYKMILDWDGNLCIGSTDPSASLEVHGNAVFNQDGADFDFRVEGNTDSELIRADASTDRIGIGTATPDSKLEVAGSIECSTGAYIFPDGSSQNTAGRVVNVTYFVASTREVLASQASHTLASFAVNKKSSTSILVCEASISGEGNAAGHLTQGWKLGSGTECIGQTLMYDENSWGRTCPSYAVITGHSTTGTQTMVMRYFSQNSTAQRPFVVYNPNATDDARLGQTQSVFVVWEIET